MSETNLPDPAEAGTFWFNPKTGVVEEGMESPGYDRIGPFHSAAEAANAPEVLQARSRAWADEEAQEDSWGS